MDVQDAIRTMPCAPEQEADVLGTCLAEGISWWKMVERRAGAETGLLFWEPSLRLVASAIQEAADANSTVTVTSIADRLLGKPGSDSLVPDVMTYLIQLQARASIRTTEDLGKVVANLTEKYQLRKQIQELEKVRTAALLGERHPNDIAGDIRNIAMDGVVIQDIQRLGDVITKLEEEDAIGVPWRLPTGIEALDSTIRGGYEPGRLYVFGARPKVGKTTVVLNSILDALAHGAVVLFASLEINERELWSKLLSAQAWIEQTRIQDLLDKNITEQSFDPEEQQRLKEARAGLKQAPLYPMFAPDIRNGVESIIAAAMTLRGLHPDDTPMIVFIDYIQLLASGESFNKSAEIGNISRRLKLFASEMDVAVVTPSQINRAGAEEGMPKPHHLRESGNLEQDADVIIMLNRPALQDESSPSHIMDFWVALNRIGKSEWVKAGYYPEFQTVRDLEDEWSKYEGTTSYSSTTNKYREEEEEDY